MSETVYGKFVVKTSLLEEQGITPKWLIMSSITAISFFDEIGVKPASEGTILGVNFKVFPIMGEFMVVGI